MFKRCKFYIGFAGSSNASSSIDGLALTIKYNEALNFSIMNIKRFGFGGNHVEFHTSPFYLESRFDMYFTALY